jgi:hypothetical protein
MSKREMSKKKKENVEEEKVYIENTEIHDVESKRPVAGKGRKEKIDRLNINRNFYCDCTK